VVKLKEIHKKTRGKTKSAHLVLPNPVLFPKKVAHYLSFPPHSHCLSFFLFLHQNKEGKKEGKEEDS